MRAAISMIAAACSLCLMGCELVDPARPTVQPDTEVFGNLIEASPDPADPSRWTARVQVGPPRALRAAEAESGKPTPEVATGLTATVTIGADTVVVVGDRQATLEAIDPGTEVVVLPVAGTTAMHGTVDLRLEAELVMDFATYRRWKLPKLALDEPAAADDPAVINSSGVESAPVPVGGGTVLYFSSRMRPPATADDVWHGALREGLAPAGEGQGPVERSYRAELGAAGWSAPELVELPGLDDALRVRVSWVSEDETACLVTVERPGEPPWVGASSRPRRAAPWAAVEPISGLGADAEDAVYLTGSRSKLVFASSRDGRERPDLFLFDPKAEGGPLPLEPQISSFGAERNPRTGPENELFFTREDRPLIFKGGRVSPLRLPGPQRVVFTQAAPTSDGAWLFFCMPRFRPLVLDQDIYVASLGADLELGNPVPVDEWRPE